MLLPRLFPWFFSPAKLPASRFSLRLFSPLCPCGITHGRTRLQKRPEEWIDHTFVGSRGQGLADVALALVFFARGFFGPRLVKGGHSGAEHVRVAAQLR